MEPGALVAYYLPEASGALAPPLRLALRDAATGRWSEREVDPGTCLGSAVAIRAAGERFLVETHLTPSASCTLVIAPDLKLVDTVPGAALAPLPNGSFLYRRSQVHFAATSGLEIALHDAGTRRSWRVYPTGPPGPVRGNAQASAKALYAELGPGWCAAHNHPCDPDAIEAGVNSEEARVGRDGSSAVLVAHLLVRDPRQQRARFEEDALVVLRGLDQPAGVEVVELSPAEARSRFGVREPEGLLEPRVLATLFRARPSRHH